MDANALALGAALAATAAAAVHGIVGHRWFTAQLASAELAPSRLFGDAEMSFRVFAVTWHVVTAALAVSAAALYLTALGEIASRDLLRFIAALHAAFLGVGAIQIGVRPAALRRPVPPVFVACMSVVVVLSWVAAGEL